MWLMTMMTVGNHSLGALDTGAQIWINTNRILLKSTLCVTRHVSDLDPYLSLNVALTNACEYFYVLYSGVTTSHVSPMWARAQLSHFP